MLEGKLVNLRALEMDDVDRLWRWFNDPEINQFLNPYPKSKALREEQLRKLVTDGNSYMHTELAIDTKDGVHIGRIKFQETKPGGATSELGILIGERGYLGKGYGTDAIRVMLRFGFHTMNLHSVRLGARADNERAIRCYEKCGFKEKGRSCEGGYSGGRYVGSIHMGILREEWEELEAANA